MKYILFITVTILLASSCSNKLKYFTQDMYDDFQWTEDELAAIQFYLSEDIVLQRKKGGEASRITHGKIRVIDGQEVEEVIIEAGTPGVFIQSPKKNRFAISFEPDESKFLMFGPNAKYNGRFVLLGKNWDNRWGTVTYGGQTYETRSASSYASLMVDLKKARNTRYKSRRAKGNKVD